MVNSPLPPLKRAKIAPVIATQTVEPEAVEPEAAGIVAD